MDDYLKEEAKRMEKTLFNKPKEVDPTKPIILYHGTSLSNFQKIKEQGIKPRGSKKSNWSGIGISRPDLVYLTNCYAGYYAVASIKKNKDQAVILKIKVDPNKTKLYLDEEFLYHILEFNKVDSHEKAKYLYSTINPKDLNPLIKKSFKREVTWVDGLNFMGTVSCDFISKEDIMGYSILDESKYSFCDPSINPLNYKIMSGEYAYQLERLNFKSLN